MEAAGAREECEQDPHCALRRLRDDGHAARALRGAPSRIPGTPGASRGSSSLRGGGHGHAAFPWRASGPKLGTLALATARAFRQGLYVPHPLAGTRR
jgi:hypothetical protein